MVVYTNADFISLNEENLTYSVLVEDKGKIAYIGYNAPVLSRRQGGRPGGQSGTAGSKRPDPGGLQGRRLRRTGCGRKCRLCRLGQKHSQGPYRLGGSRVPERPRHQQKPLSVFSYLKCYSKRRTPKPVRPFVFHIWLFAPFTREPYFFVFLPLLLIIFPAFSSYSVSAAPQPQTQRQCRKLRQKQCPQ